MVLNFLHSRLARAVCAAVEGLVGFDAVTNDSAPTVVAHGGKLVNRAFKTIERMFCVSCNDFKRQVIVVTAYFTLCHYRFSLSGNDALTFTREAVGGNFSSSFC